MLLHSGLIVTWLSVAPAQAPQTPPPAKRPASEHPAHALYIANCASCHGEKGDGRGTTVLDRPARSFLAGGFSYGNTPESIQRSIKNGIPGTPMPSFETALSESQRAQLADYVIQLGPEQVKTDPKDSLMVVGTKPIIVRGKLPPVASGKSETVRGLLVGTPDGLSFEYRIEDMRLLAVRAGEFVDRADWSGRGGDALRPLGKLVYLRPDADEEFYPRMLRLVVRLESTSVSNGEAQLIYTLSESSKSVALLRVREMPAAFRSSVGSGFRRLMQIENLADTSDWAPPEPVVRWSPPVEGRSDLSILRGLGEPGFLERIDIPQLPWSADELERGRMVVEVLKGY